MSDLVGGGEARLVVLGDRTRQLRYEVVDVWVIAEWVVPTASTISSHLLHITCHILQKKNLLNCACKKKEEVQVLTN